MIDDREIWACANQLLKQHGRDASAVASRRADELLAIGEVEGHRTFMQILDRIRQLETTTPTGRAH
mgnify:CR=1